MIVAALEPDEGPWKRTVVVCAFAIMLTFVGFGFMTPFIPLYLQQMGLTEAADVRAWSGSISAAAAFSFAISAPFWGILADRLGRRPMVVRAMWASGLALISMSFVRDPALLMAVRLVQGLFSGPVTSSIALVSATVPERNLTRSIGTIQAAVLIGGSVGPVFGGISADAIGIPATLVIGGALNLAAGTLVLAFARERFVRPERGAQKRDGALRSIRAVMSTALLVLAASQIGIQFAGMGIVSVFALYVQELGGMTGASTSTGIIQGLYSAAAALGVLGAARIASTLGFRRPLMLATTAVGLLFIPQALAPNLLALGAARVAQGFFAGLVSPLVSTLVSAWSPTERRGTVYGAMSGSSGLGGAVGPMLMGFVSAATSLQAAFWMSAAALLAAAALQWFKLGEVSSRGGSRG